MKKTLLITILLVIAFVFRTEAQFSVIHNFSEPAAGFHPHGDLISDGTFLYGMTTTGGSHLDGMIFKIMPDGSGYDTVLNFWGANGRIPQGSLIYDSTFLYGMASNGGIYDDGVVFKIKPDGTGYTKLLDFSGAATGAAPNGSLIYDGTFLYGMTRLGGINNDGVIFKIKPDGTGYSKILDFAGTTNGGDPTASLVSDGTFLYGVTYQGGTGGSGYGVIFKIMPDGTSYSKLHDFNFPAGCNPVSTLTYDGTYLYGLAQNYGTHNKGTIFKIMPDGTGYVDIFNFTGVVSGYSPNGSLIYDGTFLYGMTYSGGINDSVSGGDGVIFKIMPDGTGYSKLYDFSYTSGEWPVGSLFSDGIFLYGTTSDAGTGSGNGTIFKCGISFTTGIKKESKAQQISIYPNPSNGSFNLFISTPIKNGSVEVYNSLGELILNEKIINQQNSIDLKDQMNGLYFIKVMSDGKIVGVEKVVKE